MSYHPKLFIVELKSRKRVLIMQQFHTKNQIHVKSVTLKVKDKELMLNYYLNILKLSLLKEEDNKFYLGIKDGTLLVVLEHDENATISNGTDGLYHLALLLPTRVDLANFLAHYLKARAPFVGASDHHVSEAVYIEDPEGNGIEIYADRPSHDWRDLNNEIYMVTERLDAEDLFKYITGEFEEMPIGTIVGHLHLHVQSLEKAEAFYNDVLGFETVFKFPRSANFVSDQGYHHHIAYNVWQRNLPSRELKMTGLVSYNVNIPQNEVAQLKNRLLNNNIPFCEDPGVIRFYDVNYNIVVAEY